MTDSFDNISLTLDLPEEEAPKAPELAVEQKPAETEIPQVVLSDKDKKMIADFIPKINIRDSSIVSNYGSGAQKKIADFSESMLSSVKTKDLGEVGEIDHRKFACARGQGGEEVASDCGVDYAEFFYGAGEAGVGFLVVFGYRQGRGGRCKLRVGDIF